MPLTLESIGSEQVLGEVVASLQPLADAKHLELSLTVPEAWPEVQSDRRGLRQILINLANNAIKFTDDGRVCLAVGRDQERVVTSFSVADTGRGITETDQARLRLAVAEEPDLILLDIRMPGMDGYEVAAALSGLQHTLIVAVTASAMPEDRDRIAAAGFDGYIEKPIDVEGFIDQIERLLTQVTTAPGG